MENESSCRNEADSRFWRLLQKIMVDKTERHFDVHLEELKANGRVTDEQIEQAREVLRRFEEEKKKEKEANNERRDMDAN